MRGKDKASFNIESSGSIKFCSITRDTGARSVLIHVATCWSLRFLYLFLCCKHLIDHDLFHSSATLKPM
jgi:hypothetical protein